MERPKVSVVKCNGYDKKEVEDAVTRAIELLGGIRAFVKQGEEVLLKPNLLSASPPESAVCTHPSVVRAVIKLVKEAGARSIVGDSPGGAVNIEEVWQRSGVKEVAEAEGVELARFDEIKNMESVPVSSLALEVDSVISIPKLKTHNLFPITGAVKNIFGVVPGLYKSRAHLIRPHPRDFASFLVDIFSWVRPSLSIMDAVWSMEGEGPCAGQVRKTGLILASSDAVALDAVVSRIIGLEPLDLLTTREAAKRGLGEGDPDKIEVVGEAVDKVKVEDFKFPKVPIWHHAPPPLLRILAKLGGFKVEVDPSKCSGCGLCGESCPAGAIELKEGIPVFNSKKCILCLCCREFCPQGAVYIKRNIFVKFFGG